MMKNNEDFNRELNRLVVPLRFSVLALLSGKKASVFDDSLIRLMRYILGMKFEGKRIYKMQYSVASSSEEEEKGEGQEIEEEQEQEPPAGA